MELLIGLLALDPKKRVTAKDALAHRYFKTKPFPSVPGRYGHCSVDCTGVLVIPERCVLMHGCIFQLVRCGAEVRSCFSILPRFLAWCEDFRDDIFSGSSLRHVDQEGYGSQIVRVPWFLTEVDAPRTSLKHSMTSFDYRNLLSSLYEYTPNHRVG